MDNQHRKISGYRDLTQEELDLMNEAKELEAKVLEFMLKVELKLANASKVEEDRERQMRAQCWRWHAIGKTDIETGFMALVRSIAQPQPK